MTATGLVEDPRHHYQHPLFRHGMIDQYNDTASYASLHDCLTPYPLWSGHDKQNILLSLEKEVDERPKAFQDDYHMEMMKVVYDLQVRGELVLDRDEFIAQIHQIKRAFPWGYDSERDPFIYVLNRYGPNVAIAFANYQDRHDPSMDPDHYLKQRAEKRFVRRMDYEILGEPAHVVAALQAKNPHIRRGNRTFFDMFLRYPGQHLIDDRIIAEVENVLEGASIDGLPQSRQFAVSALRNIANTTNDAGHSITPSSFKIIQDRYPKTYGLLQALGMTDQTVMSDVWDSRFHWLEII